MTADKPFVAYFKVSFQYVIRGTWLTLRIAAKVKKKKHGSYLYTHSINTYFKADNIALEAEVSYSVVTILEVWRTVFPTSIVARGFFLFQIGPLGPTQAPIQWVTGFFFKLKWPEREANHSPPLNAKVKDGWSYTFTPFICFHGVKRENFTLKFYLSFFTHS